MNQFRTIVEKSQQNVAVMDVFSKLIQERIIFIDDVIDNTLANQVMAQMLYLNSINDKPINVYINTVGGNIIDGLGIYDVAKTLRCPIRTVCVGLAASMGSVLMLMGKERAGLKHSRYMIHQASGANIGNTEELKINLKVQESLQSDIFKIIEENTKLKNVEQNYKFDEWFTAEEALKQGILTEIL